MQLTKYTHSCVRIDDGDRALVIDPGMFSETAIALDDAHAVLPLIQPEQRDSSAVRFT